MDSSIDTELFSSPAAFRQGFEQGLEHLLDVGGLNLFILVAANASFDAALFSDLKGRLQSSYDRLFAQLQDVFIHGSRVQEADEDLLVFLKIAAIGFDSLSLTEQRPAGIWEVQFNHLRSFRPLRNSQQPNTQLQTPFDAQAFNFNKPFVQQELLWSGELAGQHFDLYYNKYPFVELHSLLVPQRERCLPQFHRRDMHDFIWRLVHQLADDLPGVRVGYNAMGAFASVNHLHFQLFVRRQRLPVESRQWRHSGGDENYPVDCSMLTGVDEAWQLIQKLHEQNQAYNLLYTPAGMYCIPRLKQGGFRLAEWSNGFSWYEMSGGMITFNHQDYATLSEAGISANLGLARLDNNTKS
jgi:ATP adenylyltransferase/5',5'''-P-1,P-4-tetraphosphate phosphorylase II